MYCDARVEAIETRDGTSDESRHKERAPVTVPRRVIQLRYSIFYPQQSHTLSFLSRFTHALFSFSPRLKSISRRQYGVALCCNLRVDRHELETRALEGS